MLRSTYVTGLLITGIFSVSLSLAQRPQTPPTGAPQSADSTRRGPGTGSRPTTGPKPFKEVITDKAKVQKGMFNVYEQEGKYFFEIPTTMIGRDILTVTRISKAAAGVRAGGGGYAGDDINEKMIRFEKGPNNRIFLKTISVLESSSDTTGMYWNVQNSNLQPIAAAFDIKAFSKDSASGVVIEVTDYIAGDNEILFFDSRAKRSFGFTMLQNDRSYIEGLRAYPGNIEIRTVKTYARSAGGAPGGLPGGGGSSEPTTLELNTSLVLLPEKPMQPRYFDDRVGYFTSQAITDFDKNPQGVETIRFIKRFKLEPRPEDLEKYKRGELVEPVKPIVYYIDPTTPKKWIPYLIQGVNDWSVAFEAAGFKNAIIAKEAPSKDMDSTWSLEDASHNAIVYKPSNIANASGPSIIDPRSGEIMETHINWYHNVMNLVRNWYMVQTAAVDPKARKMLFDEELMGQLIRFVSSHEVGHTLGLRHNFGSSSSVPVEKLRDKAWVEANGHTPSIMDYARFNYVAQPEDNINEVGLFPRIGDYDKWAIEWGYRQFPDIKSADGETGKINAWTIEKMKNPRLWWGDGESNRDDPRSQTEDLSDNAMKASSYGIKNLQRIITQLPEYTKQANEDYDGLREMYSQVAGQFGRYIGHVSSNIGGWERTPKRQEQLGPVYEYTAKTRQKEAMAWLQENVFKTPTWIVQKNINSLAGTDPAATVASLQNRALNSLVGPNTINKLLRAETELGTTTYTLTEMMTDLRKGIFSELDRKVPVDVYRRQLQKSYTEKIIGLVKPADASSGVFQILGPGFSAPSISNTSDALSTAKAQLRLIQSSIAAAVPVTTDIPTKNHLLDLQDRIKEALQPK